MKRVVITGTGILSPIGNNIDTVLSSLLTGRSGIKTMDEWDSVDGLKTRVAGVVDGADPKKINRKHRRTMGRMAILASLASLDAVADSGLSAEEVSSRRTGLSMGSTTGSPGVLEELFSGYVRTGGINTLEGTTFMKVMSHTVAANVAAMHNVQGRLIAPCCACSSSTQAVGFGFEAIRGGVQDIMICGGAEDLHASTAGVFDVIHAASKNYNTSPHQTPRPFDKNRDGLAVSEGAGVVILEEYERARARGAKIYGEILGFGTCCDGGHMTSPSSAGMRHSMELALDMTDIEAKDLDYINAHATGTLLGDIAESEAVQELVGDAVPISGTKGYTGHTLAASGAMELIFCLLMMEHGFIAPTLNLDEIDPACSGVQHVTEKIERELNYIMTSNFAFGGVNATLVIKK